MNHDMGNAECTLTKTLWRHVVNHNHRLKIIQIVPDLESSNIEVGELGDVLDIGMNKKTYLAMFLECHRIWHSVIEKISIADLVGGVSTALVLDLWTLYYMTVGYLITTNENHSIVSLHEATVFSLAKLTDHPSHFLYQEFDLVTSFLTSRLKRINKSSSLWCWTQKLTVLLIFGEDSAEPDQKLCHLLIERLLKSFELHFANYYAAHFLQWLVEMLRPFPQLSDYLFTKLHALCRSRLSDVSLWTLVGIFWRPPSTYAHSEFLRIAKGLKVWGFPVAYILPDTIPSTQIAFSVRDEISWLISVACSVLTPYKVLISINHQMGKHASEINDLLRSRYSNPSLSSSLESAQFYADSLSS